MATALFVGLSTLDIAYAVDSYPAEDTKTRARDQFLGAGGPAGNAAVAHAILSGVSPTLLTALGRHYLAEVVRGDLRTHGVTVVDTAPERTEPPPVSSIVVALGAQSRTIVSLDASRVHVPFDPEWAAYVADADLVLVDGHLPELAVGIAGCAKESGVPVVLDAGRWQDVHTRLLPLVDIAICSAAFVPPDPDPADDPFDHLHSLGPTRVAITRGAEPIRYSDAGRRGEIEVVSVPGADTLGAGDILHGAFCFHYPRSGDFVDALRRASAVATLSCRSFGTRQWGRHLNELPA
ncbi:PfkB family carbohydrate kinase [Nocardia paucivorans]|uniref:PfkB family carbohydrate kinase n=1 Tax=Nocardia paucivorans TaxID=114259 RepID=UPI0002ED1D96|nr:PfkB family carbohydrate kinase [Nocardia paucivorans]